MDSHTTESPRKAGWFKEHIPPLLLIFLIPGFSWWFFDRAETFKNEDGDLQSGFVNYYGRYKTAVSHRENAGEPVQS